MLELNGVTYYSLDEVLKNPGSKLTKEEIAIFLESNPTYGAKINNEWYCYSLAVDFMNAKKEEYKLVYLAGVHGLDMRNIHFKGRLLDIGAGGEGIIGQIAGEQSVGIAPAIHREEMDIAPGNGLKIMMDAADMQFLDNSFDSAAAFYTLLYIENSKHQKVFSEIYRVLKPGAELFIWDVAIPEKALPGKALYLVAVEAVLPDRKVKTGYGTPWKDKAQNEKYFNTLAEAAGFEIQQSLQKDNYIYLVYRKPVM